MRKFVKYIKLIAVIAVGLIILSSCGKQSGKDGVKLFNDGMAPAVKNDKYGYINTKGSFVIEPQFDYASSFSDGLAIVKTGDKYGVVDKKGQYVIQAEYDSIEFGGEHFDPSPILAKRDGVYSILDRTGKTVAILDYNNVWGFSNGLAYVSNGSKYGYIDTSGNLVIDLIYDSASIFYPGYAYVDVDGESKMIDEKGNYILPFELTKIKKNGKYGYVNKSGEIVIEPAFDAAYGFADGVARVKIDDKFGFIDKTGKYIVEPVYERANDFVDGVATVKSVDGWGMINNKGSYIVTCKHDNMGSSICQDRIGFADNGKIGYYDHSGKVVIDPLFDSLSLNYNMIGPFYSDGYAIVRSEDSFGVIDKSGKTIITPQVDGILSYKKESDETIVNQRLMNIMADFVTDYDVLKMRDGLKSLLPKCNKEQASTVNSYLDSFSENNLLYMESHFVSFRTYLIFGCGANYDNKGYLTFTRNGKQYKILVLESDEYYRYDAANAVNGWGLIGHYNGYMLDKNTTVTMREWSELCMEYAEILSKQYKNSKGAPSWGWQKGSSQEEVIYDDDLGNQMYVVWDNMSGNCYLRAFIK